MGHINEKDLKLTAKIGGVRLTGTYKTCVPCMKAKFKTLNIRKETITPTAQPGERLYLDLSTIKAPSLGGTLYWALIVDDYTKMKWSFFLKKKSDLAIQGLQQLHAINKHHRIINIRMDNAGENKSLAAQVQSSPLVVNFEYTAPDTPQHNGVVERGFA